jgi:FkbM family methyltransferase
MSSPLGRRLDGTFSINQWAIILFLLVAAIPLAFNFNLLQHMAVYDNQQPPPSTPLQPLASSSQDDPERTDCTKLLNKFKADEIEVAKKEGDVNFRRSFVTISKSVPNPFYIATHDKGIDGVRASIMEYHDYYESRLTELIANLFVKKHEEGKKSIFLDVGANIGWFSLVAAAHGATKVYSFEPNLQNTIRFCESLSLNGWATDDLVVPINKGAGTIEEKKNLYATDSNNPGAYSFKPMGSRAVVGEMEITTLDLFAERHGWFESRPSIGFFKLDVEYFELEVMEGAKKLIRSQIIEMIGLELKPDHPETTKYKICKLLLDSGYEFYMHGAWQGPDQLVTVNYVNVTQLVADFQADKYKENVVFRLKDK